MYFADSNVQQSNRFACLPLAVMVLHSFKRQLLFSPAFNDNVLMHASQDLEFLYHFRQLALVKVLDQYLLDGAHVLFKHHLSCRSEVCLLVATIGFEEGLIKQGGGIVFLGGSSF